MLGWLVVGLVAGGLARVATGGGWNLGCLGTLAVGVAGGLLGGIVFDAAGDRGIGDFGLRSMLVAFVGAVLLLALASLLGARPRRRGGRGLHGLR